MQKVNHSIIWIIGILSFVVGCSKSEDVSSREVPEKAPTIIENTFEKINAPAVDKSDNYQRLFDEWKQSRSDKPTFAIRSIPETSVVNLQVFDEDGMYEVPVQIGAHLLQLQIKDLWRENRYDEVLTYCDSLAINFPIEYVSLPEVRGGDASDRARLLKAHIFEYIKFDYESATTEFLNIFKSLSLNSLHYERLTNELLDKLETLVYRDQFRQIDRAKIYEKGANFTPQSVLSTKLLLAASRQYRLAGYEAKSDSLLLLVPVSNR